MKIFTVNSPNECPWRITTYCTYHYGGYANPNIKCGPHMTNFPNECPLTVDTAEDSGTQPTASNNGYKFADAHAAFKEEYPNIKQARGRVVAGEYQSVFECGFAAARLIAE